MHVNIAMGVAFLMSAAASHVAQYFFVARLQREVLLQVDRSSENVH